MCPSTDDYNSSARCRQPITASRNTSRGPIVDHHLLLTRLTSRASDAPTRLSLSLSTLRPIHTTAHWQFPFLLMLPTVTLLLSPVRDSIRIIRAEMNSRILFGTPFDWEVLGSIPGCVRDKIFPVEPPFLLSIFVRS